MSNTDGQDQLFDPYQGNLGITTNAFILKVYFYDYRLGFVYFNFKNTLFLLHALLLTLDKC